MGVYEGKTKKYCQIMLLIKKYRKLKMLYFAVYYNNTYSDNKH